jgi:hypothetical protein
MTETDGELPAGNLGASWETAMLWRWVGTLCAGRVSWGFEEVSPVEDWSPLDRFSLDASGKNELDPSRAAPEPPAIVMPALSPSASMRSPRFSTGLAPSCSPRSAFRALRRSSSRWRSARRCSLRWSFSWSAIRFCSRRRWSLSISSLNAPASRSSASSSIRRRESSSGIVGRLSFRLEARDGSKLRDNI